MIEIAFTRDDANTDTGIVGEWLVDDRAEVRKGRPICVLETSKASVELDAPGTGTLFQLVAAGIEVELGATIALLAETEAEAAELAGRREREPEPAPAAEAAPGEARATRKAVELAREHGIDLAAIRKEGFVTATDVEALIAAATAGEADEALARARLDGLSLDGVTLPASIHADEARGALDPEFLERLLREPDAFRALADAEKVAAYREHGAEIGEDVTLAGALVVAPRIAIGDGATIGPGGTVRGEELVAIGALSSFGPGLELHCRRAYLGAGIWAGGAIRIGGGGRRDPWATLVVGDRTFLGDEVFVNVCRPVVIGGEVFLTQRSMIVTHNIGHSLLEGFENRFAPVVLEDRAQVGLASVVYAGCRVGREAIVASSSYVVSDIPAGRLAIGVPAKAVGASRRAVARPRQVELARTMVAELRELLELRGHDVSPLVRDAFEVTTPAGASRVSFVDVLRAADQIAVADAETVVLTLELRDVELPDGCAAIDLLGRRFAGAGGPVAETVREFCRKRGITLEPWPWRYAGGLI